VVDLRGRARLLLDRKQLADARTALGQAESRLGPRGHDGLRQEIDDLRAELERAEKDERMLAAVEEARLRMAAAGKDGFDRAGADRLFREAFEGYGLDLEKLPPEEVGRRVRDSAIAEALVAGLDEWARTVLWHRARLWEVADRADRDEWRRGLRRALAKGNWKAIRQLAGGPLPGQLSPAAAVWLAHALRGAGEPKKGLEVLREAQRRHCGDFWLCFELAFAATDLGPAGRDEGVRYFTAAQALRPGSAVVHYNLGLALYEQGKLAEAVAAYKDAIGLKHDYPEAHNNLGLTLYKQGKLAEAIAAYKDAIRFKRDYPRAHANLGIALAAQGKLAEAVTAYREAIRLEPGFPVWHYNLGNALYKQGKLAGAIAAYRQAIRLKHDYPRAHTNLGNVLHRLGKPAEAVAAYREAIRLEPDFHEAHYNLGNTLQQQGKLAEAVAAYGQAIRFKHDHPEAHYHQGNALKAQGKLAEAVAAYRGAIHVKHDFPEAHINLGVALYDQGNFPEALGCLRKGHELGRRRPGWPTNLRAAQIRQVARFVELDRDLPAFLADKRKPSGPVEQLQLAVLCAHPARRLYAASARFCAAAFAADGALADALSAGHRYNAARSATLAAAGQGQDAAQLDARERARLRQQALDWLKADLGAWARLAQKGPPAARQGAQQALQHWQRDAGLASVRDAAALAKLSEAERRAWEQFWAEVDQALKKFSAPGRAR
jgi:tetratricopeptide (TPR) repeat protein